MSEENIQTTNLMFNVSRRNTALLKSIIMEIAIALLVSAIITSVVNYSTAQSANEQSMINQMNQNNWNARQAQIAREWESPANQMKLFQDAGINPAMAASGLTGISGQGIQAASGSGAPVFQPDFSNLMQIAQAYAGGKNEIAQAENTNKQTGWIDRLNDAQQKKLLQEINESISKQNLNETEARSLDNAAQQLVRMNDAQVQKIHEETNNLMSIGEQISAQTEKIKSENKLVNKDIELAEANISNIQADTALKELQTKQSESQTAMNYQSIAESAARIGFVNTEKMLKQKEIDLTNAKTLKELNDVIIQDYRIRCIENNFDPDSNWINNCIRLFNSGIKEGPEQLWNGWNNAVNSLFDRIGSFFTNINQGVKEHDSTKNIYGNSWNSSNQTNWYTKP